MTNITIRTTTVSDWAALRAMRLASLLDSPTAFGMTYASAAACSEQQWQERASNEGLGKYTLAFDDTDAVGMIGHYLSEAGEINLIAMWLKPEYRGRGIAEALVDSVKAASVAQGHYKVVLDVSPDNARAAAFYRKQDFVFLPHWEPLASHPAIYVQKMEWHMHA